MPCYSEYYDDDKRNKAELDKVTRLLCSLTNTLTVEGQQMSTEELNELNEWIAEHRKCDAEKMLRTNNNN